MNFMSTVAGSLLEGFYPAGWDMAKIDACCDKGVEREAFWNDGFNPVVCESLGDFDTLMGHEIAMQIKLTGEEGRKLAMILPVGPMGMYRWAAYFLNEWDVDCSHVTTFNMDEWADADGNTLPNTDTASFEYSMREAFFNKVNKTIPEKPGNVNKNLIKPYFVGKFTGNTAKVSSLYYVNDAKITLYNGKKAEKAEAAEKAAKLAAAQAAKAAKEAK